MVSILLSYTDDISTLELSIRSVFAQVYPHWELILIDDGSGDGSRSLAERIQDPRVRARSDGRTAGLPARLNEGVSLAGGEFVARMDADDAMHPLRLARQVACLRETDADLVGTRAIAIDERGMVRGAYAERPLPSLPREYMRNGVFTHPTVTGRVEWFRENPYDPTLRKSQDKDLWCRTSGSSRFLKMDEFLLFYRIPTTVPLAKYRETRSFDRIVIRRWGPTLAGRSWTLRELALSYGKEAIYGAAHRARLPAHLESRRLVALPEAQRAKAEQTLAQIASTAVPGWRPGR